MALTLSYTNEDDRAYGLAGMALSLASLNAIDRIVELSLDSDGPMVEFSSEYYFPGSPAISPKSTWENLMRNFHITAAMVISNVMSRSLVRLHEDIPDTLLKEIYEEILNEGCETCGLEEDEVKSLYDKTFARQIRIFGNPRLRPAVEELAHIISRKRRLSGMELRDELAFLQLI